MLCSMCSRRAVVAVQGQTAMVVERCVVEMVLERGETRHDVVVNGLKEIALCGKVSMARTCARPRTERPGAVWS